MNGRQDIAVRAVAGVHHLKLPVSDVVASRRWYVETLGFEHDLEFVEEGRLAGVSVRHPGCGLRIALREDRRRAQAMAGFGVLALAVVDDAGLDAVIAGFDARGVTHSGRRHAREGWAVEVHDPDGMAMRLYSLERHADG